MHQVINLKQTIFPCLFVAALNRKRHDYAGNYNSQNSFV